jgi:T4 RnlA family RNA ligase
MNKLDINKLDQLVAEGKLMVQTEGLLRIYKYTPETQFSKDWDELTSQCRGLVVDMDGYQFSNPIPKFFNIEELPPESIPNLPYEITDKVDGSCIEVFWYGGDLIVCTLGSFASDQAKLAEQMITSEHGYAYTFDAGRTYIFELVAPENRIVLDYGNEKKLVLLAIRDNDTGKEEPYEELLKVWPHVVERVDKTIEEILVEKKREDFINKEGFVIRFSNGFRVKVKYEEYFRLHKIMTGVNEKFVWEFLKEGKPLPLENVPDEFFQYVTGVKDRLIMDYTAVELSATNSFEEIYYMGITRKDFALQALKKPYSSVLFKMLEKKDYTDLIWKIVEPKSSEVKKFNSFRGEA